MSEGGDKGAATMSGLGPMVAVIDDDAGVCESTRFLLETYDFEVQTYLSGADFLRDNPDIACLIVDYRLPGLNGLEFVSELRTRGSLVPAIMISATADPVTERRAAELGIKRILQKPLSNAVLLRAVREVLRRKSASDRIPGYDHRLGWALSRKRFDADQFIRIRTNYPGRARATNIPPNIPIARRDPGLSPGRGVPFGTGTS
jgi:DNA-binding response OmpR family regulator